MQQRHRSWSLSIIHKNQIVVFVVIEWKDGASTLWGFRLSGPLQSLRARFRLRRDEGDCLKRNANCLVYFQLLERILNRDVVRVAECACSRFARLVEYVFWFGNGELAGCFVREIRRNNAAGHCYCLLHRELMAHIPRILEMPGSPKPPSLCWSRTGSWPRSLESAIRPRACTDRASSTVSWFTSTESFNCCWIGGIEIRR